MSIAGILALFATTVSFVQGYSSTCFDHFTEIIKREIYLKHYIGPEHMAALNASIKDRGNAKKQGLFEHYFQLHRTADRALQSEQKRFPDACKDASGTELACYRARRKYALGFINNKINKKKTDLTSMGEDVTSTCRTFGNAGKLGCFNEWLTHLMYKYFTAEQNALINEMLISTFRRFDQLSREKMKEKIQIGIKLRDSFSSIIKGIDKGIIDNCFS